MSAEDSSGWRQRPLLTCIGCWTLYLPDEITTSHSLFTFRQQLKTWLFWKSHTVIIIWTSIFFFLNFTINLEVGNSWLTDWLNRKEKQINTDLVVASWAAGQQNDITTYDELQRMMNKEQQAHSLANKCCFQLTLINWPHHSYKAFSECHYSLVDVFTSSSPLSSNVIEINSNCRSNWNRILRVI